MRQMTVFFLALISLTFAQFSTAQDSSQLVYLAGGQENYWEDTYEIAVMNTDGSERNRITESAALPILNSAYMFSVSPDGTRIAARLKAGGNWDIYTMDIDGANLVQLTEDRHPDHSPGWSPDGTKIAFASVRGAPAEIYVMDADGANLVQLTDNNSVDSAPAWSPDGRKIAFLSNRDDNADDIYLMNADGSNPVRLTDSPNYDQYPAWSPDGSQIAYSSVTGAPAFQGDIYVMNADGSNKINLTNNEKQNIGSVWSPDGNQIVFNSDRDRGIAHWTFDLFVMDANGDNPFNLSDSPSTNEIGAAWVPGVGGVSGATIIEAISWGQLKAQTR